MSNIDTIFALATPPGKSGVAIIRMSGPAALPSLQQISRLTSISPNKAYYTAFCSPMDGNLIDHGIALYFAAPRSFTGEDVVELQLHGSLAIIRETLTLLANLGLRPAEPGEFSRRAFLNGKMDLLEAEGLADIIAAETPAQKQQALRQMHGDASRYYDDLRTRVLHCLAPLEAYIDFPDEDIPESVLTQLTVDIHALLSTIQQTLNDQKRGERLRDGISIVILGAPNAGKSSLLNVLSRRDAAIVSAKAGTTRDVIEVHMDIAGYPAILIDTAGLRDTADDIEEEGVRRALQRAGNADIKLVLFDGAHWPKRDKKSEALLDDKALLVINKADILTTPLDLDNAYSISTRTGQGVDKLLQALEERIVHFFSSGAAPFITRERHRILLNNSIYFLQSSLSDLPLELKCEELRQAAVTIGKITGKIQVDDVLDVIFKSFCIGK